MLLTGSLVYINKNQHIPLALSSRPTVRFLVSFYGIIGVQEINKLQSSVETNIETSHFVCTANQMIGFYKKRNIGLKRVKKTYASTSEIQKLDQTYLTAVLMIYKNEPVLILSINANIISKVCLQKLLTVAGFNLGVA